MSRPGNDLVYLLRDPVDEADPAQLAGPVRPVTAASGMVKVTCAAAVPARPAPAFPDASGPPLHPGYLRLVLPALRAFSGATSMTARAIAARSPAGQRPGPGGPASARGLGESVLEACTTVRSDE